MDYRLPDVCPSLNPIERVLIWLSGAEESCLRKCPKWEKRKYEAFGASVLVPVSFGMIGSSYAISTLTDSLMIIIGFAIVWGAIILTIDRVLLATYRAFTTKSKKATQFFLRIIVAVLMGLTVSHPLVLLLFKDTINSEIAKERTVEMKTIRSESDTEKKVIEDRISEAAQNLAQLQNKYQETIAGDFATETQSNTQTSIQNGNADQRFTDIDLQLSELKNEREQIRQGLEKWQQTYDDEISGVRGGSAGVGPKARSIETDHLIWRREEMTRLNKTITDLTTRRVNLSSTMMEKSAAANEAIDSRRRELEKQKLDLFASQQGQLVDVINDQIASSSAELDRLRGDAKQLSIDISDRLSDIKTERRADMMSQTIILHHIFEDPDNGGHFALMVYIIIATLFTLIDTLPLVVKFFSVPGPYDMLIHIEGTKYTPFHNLRIEEDTEKFESQDKAFRQQMEARINMFRDVDHYWGSNIPVLPNEGTTANPSEVDSLVEEVKEIPTVSPQQPELNKKQQVNGSASTKTPTNAKDNLKNKPPIPTRKAPVKAERIDTRNGYAKEIAGPPVTRQPAKAVTPKIVKTENTSPVVTPRTENVSFRKPSSPLLPAEKPILKRRRKRPQALDRQTTSTAEDLVLPS